MAARIPLLTGIFLVLFLTGIVSAVDFTYMPVDYGTPANFTLCHPSLKTLEGETISADFVADRTVGDAPLTVRFYDTSYGFADFWEWDFGDGNVSYAQNPSFTYTEPGTYDVSLRIGSRVSYETSAARYNKTGKGQFTDITYSSIDREIEYITVNEKGSGTTKPVPAGWYPEQAQPVLLPSGQTGVKGNVALDAATITITPTTQKGFTDTLSVNGIYRIHTSTPYNTAF